MKFLGDILGCMLLSLLILFMWKGDELLLSMGEGYVAAFELCLQLDECVVTFSDVDKYIWGQKMVEKYSEVE